MDEVLRKITAARTRLILDKPFLGALVLRLPLKAVNAPWCPTTATDARTLYYNPEYIRPLNVSQVQFVLSHDALHCALSHFARRENRDLHRWNVACDHAVNQLLQQDNLDPPPGSLANDNYAGMSAEEIYPFIPGDTEEQTLDEHLYDVQPQKDADDEPGNDQSHSKQPNLKPPSSPDSDNNQAQPTTQNQQIIEQREKQDEQQEQEQEQEQEQYDQSNEQEQQHDQNNVRSYADRGDQGSQHQSHSKSTAESESESESESEKNGSDGAPKQQQDNRRPPPLSALEREQLKTQWQQRLAGAAQQASQAGKLNGSVARLVERVLRSSVPWRNVLARYMSGSARMDYNLSRPSQRREGEAIMPSLHARQIDVVVALDTSGSIQSDELNEFAAELNAIKSLVNARVTVLACDSELDDDGPWVYEPWDHLILPESFNGDGGTNFNPVFNWIHTKNLHPDLIIYFTDAKGRFPDKPAATETLWLVKGSAKVPWGKRIQLN